MTTVVFRPRCAPQRPRPATRRTARLVVVSVSYVMILLDNSVIFAGLQSIRAGLDLRTADLS